MPKKKPVKASKSQPKKQTKKTKKPVAKPKAVNTKLPSVISIAKTSWLVLWRNRKPLSLIILIYGVVYLVLVLGLSSPANSSSIKNSFDSVFHGHFGQFYSSLNVFTYLIGSTTSNASSGSAYQIFIVIVASLSIIWSLRQFYLGVKVRARDSYYRGLYPIVPYLLVVLYIIVELVPLIAGLALYNYLITDGIAVTNIEKILSIIPVVTLVGFSFYLLSSSILASYIVTLPEMTPLKAIRSANDLVRGRRWNVFRKIVFLPILLFVVAGIVILPFILVVTSISAWIFFILTLIALVYIHSYLYSLYRSLINE